MISVLESALDCAAGALEAVRDPSGVTFHRSPGAARSLLGDITFEYMSAIPSGVRFELITDASFLELEVELTKAVMPGMTPTGSAFDLVVDGELRPPVVVSEATLVRYDPATGGLEFEPGGIATVRLDLDLEHDPEHELVHGRQARERRVEIWLPTDAALKLLDVRAPQGASLRRAPAKGPVWIHHGSSISQCSEADRPTGAWPARVARAVGTSLLNLGLGGQCHLDQFMARTIRDLPADAISLELGINVLNGDSMRERAFVPAFHGFLDTIRDGHPDTPILIVTPIICPVAEQQPGPTSLGQDNRVHTVQRPAQLATGALTLIRIRELLHQHVDGRRKDGDARLHIIDGTALFGPDEVADLPDGLHPNAAGYRRMADRFQPLAFGEEGVLR